MIVESGSLRYRTAHLADALFRDSFIRNDLTGYDDVRIETPLNRQELRNPREEDKERARNLLDHLNEHIERYHHVIWGLMSADRRYMLLDGFEAPNSGGRSVASVVENELVGIVGNCLVLPVARGFHLDPTFKQDVENPIDLLEHYQPNTPIEPSPRRDPDAGRLLRGRHGCLQLVRGQGRDPVLALGGVADPRLAAADPADVDRHAPCGAARPHAEGLPAGRSSRCRSAPAAPDPDRVGAALQLLGQGGVFRDITGPRGHADERRGRARRAPSRPPPPSARRRPTSHCRGRWPRTSTRR